MTSYCEHRPKADPKQRRKYTAIYGTPISHSVAPSLFDIIFADLDLPDFKYTIRDTKEVESKDSEWRIDIQKPDTVGTCVTMPLKLAVMPYVDEMTDQAKAVGSVNTTYFRENPDGSAVHVGTNLDVAGVGNSLLSALLDQSTPFPEETPLIFSKGSAASLMIGGGGATRAAIYAMNKAGLSPIFLLNRDQGEIDATVQQFPDLDIRPLTSVSQAREALKELDSKGITLCAGVGAIPSIEPKSDAEKNVYEIAKVLFEHPYSSNRKSQPAGSMQMPAKPCFLEMAYKPRETIMRGIAEARSWHTICGVEVVLEGCFEQAYLWTGRIVPSSTREKGRKALRG